jgi:hypothetical protein
MATVKKGNVKVGEKDYRWRVLRHSTWTRGRDQEFTLLGLAILVEPTESSRRELLLQFDIDPTRHGDMPHHQRFHLPDGRLAEVIEGAIKAGWEPDSRGKRFVHEAGVLQPR